MELHEFLALTNYNNGTATVDITALSNADAAAEARGYLETKLWRIQGDVRKTQVETAVIVNDTIDRLQENIDTSSDANVVKLSKAVKRALENLYKPEFYINLNDPTVTTMLAQAQALGVLIPAEIDEITAAATYASFPFANVTTELVAATRNPAVTRDVTIPSGQVVIEEGSIYGQADTGAFRFTLTPAEDFNGNVRVNVWAKKDGETVFTQFPQLPITIGGTLKAGVPVSHTFKRTASLSQYRHFKFTFDEPYANAVTGVIAEGV